MRTIRTILTAAALLLLAGAPQANAQSSPNLIFGQVPTAGQWNSYFAAKQDVLGYTPVNKSGDVMTGPLITAASTTSLSGFNIPPGVAPTSPQNGDLWLTATGLFVRVNGTTVGPLISAGTAGITVGTSTVAGGVSGRVLFDNAGVVGEYTQAQLTAQINAVTASLSGAIPAFPNTTTTFFRGDGTYAGLPGSFTGFANPSTLIGLTPINGAATTAMRSDAAAALDQSIAPIWTGAHTYTVARTIASSTGAALDDVLISTATTTISGNAGSPITSLSKVRLGQPTITDASAVTVTDAATLDIVGAPIAGGSVTITNAWSLRVEAGNVKFAGTGNALGTITSGVWSGTSIDLSHGGTNNSLTASNGGIVWSDATKLNILAGTVTAGQCLLSGSTASPSWGSCSGAAAVSSVSNGDGTLTISPTTGAVVASLALGHANTWTAAITDTVAPPQVILGVNTTTGGAIQFFGSTSGNLTLKPAAAAGSSVTLTMPGVTDTVAVLGLADQLIAGGANVTSQSLTTGNVTIDCGSRPLQFIANTGTFTITAPSNDGSCILQVENGAGASASVGFTGFTVGSNTGDAFTTTNGNKFAVSIWRVHSISSYFVKALQ